jgi:hypothetical protein
MGLCYKCRHWRENDDDDVPVCDAYPDGIPQQIMNAALDHTVPQPGDHGIRFEADEGVDPAVIERILAKIRS